MRIGVRVAAATLGVVIVAACVNADRTTGTHDHDGTPVSLDYRYNDPARVDTGGGRLPDLVVDEQATAQHWVVREEKLPAEFCSVQEGGVTPGLRRLIRFTVTTPNIGDADVFVGSPLNHADPNGDGDFSDNDGMFEFASCHAHFHFQNYAVYRLIDVKTGKVWRSAKKGFCMLDTDPNPASTYSGESPAGDRNYLNCGTLTRDGFQGVSHGWSDTYVFQLAGQYFILDGGDGQPVVPPGDYYIEVTVNPGYAPAKKGGCRLAQDPKTGLCHNFAEKSYANNSMRTKITISDHSGRGAQGPEKESKIYDYELVKGM
jgi:hypothetical protein